MVLGAPQEGSRRRSPQICGRALALRAFRGHRLFCWNPTATCHNVPRQICGNPSRALSRFSAKSEEEAIKKAEAKLGVKGVKVERDEDVLDTWFSEHPTSKLACMGRLKRSRGAANEPPIRRPTHRRNVAYRAFSCAGLLSSARACPPSQRALGRRPPSQSREPARTRL